MGFLSLTWSLLDLGGRRAALWMVLLAFLAAIAKASGLGSVGYIPQSIYLRDDTLRRNIAFGVADESIDEAALGRAVSAAQRQRIGIARALYNDPPVLVMNEATSALDNATEREVMQAINGLRGSKTILIVAHRLSTLNGCDSVIEVAAGSIVRSGTLDSVAGVADENVRGSVD